MSKLPTACQDCFHPSIAYFGLSLTSLLVNFSQNSNSIWVGGKKSENENRVLSNVAFTMCVRPHRPVVLFRCSSLHQQQLGFHCCTTHSHLSATETVYHTSPSCPNLYLVYKLCIISLFSKSDHKKIEILFLSTVIKQLNSYQLAIKKMLTLWHQPGIIVCCWCHLNLNGGVTHGLCLSTTGIWAKSWDWTSLESPNFAASAAYWASTCRRRWTCSSTPLRWLHVHAHAHTTHKQQSVITCTLTVSRHNVMQVNVHRLELLCWEKL